MPLANPRLPPTPKQVEYARHLANRLGARIPPDAACDRRALSQWIDAHKARCSARRSPGATSKQVAFAERIARIKRRAVPDECFRDARLMSRWIEGNK